MTSKTNFLQKCKPAVRLVWLLFSAGLVWFGVGLMLVGFAHRWLTSVSMSSRSILAIAGILLAAMIYFFGFSKLARKNIQRIKELEGEKVCLFAFQEWKSYPLVLFMVLLGLYLRIYSPFPKPLLAILYIGIGGGLFSASLHYFANIARELRVAA